MKLKELKVDPSPADYATDFFESVAAQGPGKYFKFEVPGIKLGTVRSAAYTQGKRLGKKFSAIEVPTEEGTSIAVTITTKTRVYNGRKPRTTVTEPLTAEISEG